jgi:hypothetical protein
MPKKKLTKAQVKRKIKTISNAMYDLFNDKVGHGADSNTPQSWKSLAEAHSKWVSSWRRL